MNRWNDIREDRACTVTHIDGETYLCYNYLDENNLCECCRPSFGGNFIVDPIPWNEVDE
jgi:hypothetical protein